MTIGVALFGTSADPPTAGHQAILSWLSQHFDRVLVWAANNPFKLHQSNLEDRAAMLELLISDINSPRENIRLVQDLSRLRTLETVKEARLRWGDDTEFTLVVGSDLLDQLPRWYRFEELLQQVQLLVIPRPGYVIHDYSLEKIQQLGGKISVASLTGLDVSSTAFREEGELDVLTPSVVDYINRKHLYKCQDKDERAKEKLHLH